MGVVDQTNRKSMQKEMNTMYRDPICGMQVDPRTAAGESEYQGQKYYFCSPGCKKTFDADPPKYAESDRQHATMGHSMHDSMGRGHGCC
jgi:YHS domain-containing protein